MFAEYIQYITSEMRMVIDHAVTFVPKVFVAIVLLLITKLAAVIIRGLSVKVFRVMGMNVLSKKLGVDTFLKSIPDADNLSALLGGILYWIFMFIGFTYSLQYLGFQLAQVLLTSIVFYIPRIAAALVILLLGIYIAGLLGKWVEKSVSAIHGRYAGLAGGTVKSIFIFLTMLTILDELGVNLEYVRVGIYLTAGAVAAILVLMFGVGSIRSGKDIVAGIMLRTYLNEETIVILEGEAWRVERVLGTVVRVRQGSRVMYVPNSILTNKSVIRMEESDSIVNMPRTDNSTGDATSNSSNNDSLCT